MGTEETMRTGSDDHHDGDGNGVMEMDMFFPFFMRIVGG